MKESTDIIKAGFYTALVTLPFSAALGIEPPPDDARPPSAMLRRTANVPQKETPALGNMPFLGLSTATLPEMVADHLSLSPGTGVIIRTVVPDSPAEKAGLSVNDIILDIGGTEVGDPQALSSAVREHKPGDRLAISLIHKGKPSKVEVTLAQRPADPTSLNEPDPMLDGIPGVHADRLRDMIERHLQGLNQNGGLGLRIFPEEFRRSLPETTFPKGFVVPQNQPGESGFQQNSTIRLMDDQGSIEIKSSNGQTEATVRDAKNETVWTGPWNTEEDKAAAPDGVRERIGRVRSADGSGFNFRMRNHPAKPGTIDN